MTLLLLLHGEITIAAGPPANGLIRWWGPMYPDVWGTTSFWGPHYPDRYSPSIIFGNGPQGAGTFELVLESGTKVTYTYNTDVFKSFNGKEYRANNLELPAQDIDGAALMLGDAVLQNRSRIARYASLGTPFLLGIAYEELTLTEDTVGTTLNVSTTSMSLCDWANPGQRVIIETDDGENTQAVVQSSTSNTIVIDQALGALAAKNSRVMPALAVYLEPQQSFTRYTNPDTVEHWQIMCKSLEFDYAGTGGQRSILPLATPITNSGNLDYVILQALEYGIAGDDLRCSFVGDALAASGELEESGNDTIIHFMPDTTTLQDLYDLITGASTMFSMIGTWDPLAVVAGGDDAFGLSAFDGGADSVGYWGRGASLTNWAGSPVWDRRLVAKGAAATDSVHTMAEIADMGGIPFPIPEAYTPDWGRAVSYNRSSKSEWQWFKLFMNTVKGRWKGWWLPSWRSDLVATASGAGTLTILGPDDPSDFTAWFPNFKNSLQVLHTDNSVTYVRISGYVDNNDGSLTLSIIDQDGNPLTIPATPISMISWLEYCRWEDDKFEVTWESHIFNFEGTARVIQGSEIIVAVPAPPPSFTVDGTSGMGVPTAAEWPDVHPGAASPVHLYAMQEASGDLTDSVGGATLVANVGYTDYAQAVAGWARTFLGEKDNAFSVMNFVSTSASLPDPSTTSQLLILYVTLTGTPSVEKEICAVGGTGNIAYVTATTTPNLSAYLSGGGGMSTGAVAINTSVHPLIVQVDRANSVYRVITDDEVITPTWSTPLFSNKLLSLGSLAFGQAAPALFGYGAVFSGSAAELTRAQIKTMLETLGWTVAWTP